MAFGSGGTITALAETDARITGYPNRAGSLLVLRRQRLKTLLELLLNVPAAKRAAMISGDPKRADIIIAGGFVLHEIMSEIGLEYIFVSRRGLRDGLMVDLLQQRFSESGPWHPDADRAESLDQVCQKYLYDAAHAHHVSQLALNLFYQLHDLHGLPEKYASILHAAAMLHDIGLFLAGPKHHKHSYYLIKSSGMNSFNRLDLDLVANVARYHRKAHPSPKHLGFSQLSPSNQEIVRKLSALVRVADAFDFKHGQQVDSLSCTFKKARSLTLSAASSANLKEEIHWAGQKGKLIQEVFNVDLTIEKNQGAARPIAEFQEEKMRRAINERNVLFLCQDNAQLSQMAEAAAKHLAPPKTRIFSAGIKPGRIPPAVIAAMNEIGIPMADHKSKGLSEVPVDEIDLVISFGDAHNQCANLPGRTKVESWPVPAERKSESA